MAAEERETTEQAAPHAETNGAPPPENGAVRPQGVDPWRRFLSPSPNAPQPCPDSIPSEEEYLRLNQRRGELIHQKYSTGGLTPEEEAELQRVEVPVLAYVNFHHPLPPVNLEYLKELARATGIDLGWVEGT